MTGVIQLHIDVQSAEGLGAKTVDLNSVVVPRVGERIYLPDGFSYEVQLVTYVFRQADWIRPEVYLVVH